MFKCEVYIVRWIVFYLCRFFLILKIPDFCKNNNEIRLVSLHHHKNSDLFLRCFLHPSMKYKITPPITRPNSSLEIDKILKIILNKE